MKLRRRKALLLISARNRIKRKRKEALEKEKRRFWVRGFFAERQTKGEFHTLVPEAVPNVAHKTRRITWMDSSTN